ncbi:hypothetical protein MNBD_GAMMA22-2522 [hydrothermal vent metagenome]|uniref:Uncharacterized protein n=1 Tax=hydrothermal vent metagenome TaxID=652676 RepID=A0A3B1A1D7_9ZZZZ
MKPTHKAYIKTTIIFIVSALLTIFVFNYTLDPLWYFGGNKLFSENYSFNERFSKVNQYLKAAEQYDCILLGSSRVTLLDARQISGYNCFNFAFSDGNPEEFIAYAKYIRRYGLKPRLSIIGIDARFYSRKNHKVIVPDFVQQLERPPLSLKTYLSFNALNFSLRTLLRKPPQHRYYTDELIGAILAKTKDYQPPPCFNLEGFGLSYTDKKIHYLTKVKSELKSDSIIGYVAPVSAWDLMPLLEDGKLNSYLQTMYQISKQFDRFYDFSVPSDLTKRTDNNYDGHHYSRASNDEVAKVLSGGKLQNAIALHAITLLEYQRLYTDSLVQFSKTLQNIKKSSWKCRKRSAMR